MMQTTILEMRGKMIEARAGQTLKHALEKADILPETVLAVRDGELLTEDDILHAGETIQLIPVISGGRL